MLRWLSRQGVRPLLVDWGTPTAEDAGQGLAYHVKDMLAPLIDALGTPPYLVGYCLGGTLAHAVAALRPTLGVATIAAPWRFSRYSEDARTAIATQWFAAKPICEALGLIPMEVLQAGFWQLDPSRTIHKFERFSLLLPDSAEARAFVALEDWANAGAPLTLAAGADMFDHLFKMDRPGMGRWWIDGIRIAPRKLRCPTIEFISANDRIVPAGTAIGLKDQYIISTGHVGMVVGSRAKTTLWEPLRDWLIAALHTKS